MSKRALLEREVTTLLEHFLQDGDAVELKSYILSHSNLPGPRANLELAAALGDAVAGQPSKYRDHLWTLCEELTGISSEQAPTNDPREFLPFCGAVSIGSMGATWPHFYKQALSMLRALANDPRWRMREAVCMGLQRLASTRADDTLRELNGWIAEGSLLELRAVAAAVADSALLKNEVSASTALQMHEQIFQRVLAAQDRRSAEFRALRKGLGYTLSLVIAAMPSEGFALVSRLIDTRDRDVIWVMKQNLKKNRLIRRFPEEIESTKRLLN